MPTKKPKPTDVLVGQRVRMARLMSNMSQTVSPRARCLQELAADRARVCAAQRLKDASREEARRLLTAVERLAPEDPEILRHLGEMYVKKSDRARAVDAFKRALRNKPDENARHAIEEELLQLETGKLAVGSGR